MGRPHLRLTCCCAIVVAVLDLVFCCWLLFFFFVFVFFSFLFFSSLFYLHPTPPSRQNFYHSLDYNHLPVGQPASLQNLPGWSPASQPAELPGCYRLLDPSELLPTMLPQPIANCQPLRVQPINDQLLPSDKSPIYDKSPSAQAHHGLQPDIGHRYRGWKLSPRATAAQQS